MSAPLTDLLSLNRLLGAGVHFVRATLEAAAPGFSLELTVVDREGARHTLLCRDVQNLELLPEGDALAKPMRLEIADLRDDHLDRIAFSLEELERDTLFLHCAAFEVDGQVLAA